MTILEYKQHIAAGLPVEAGSPAHLFMHAMSQEAIRITMEINNRYHTPEELRALLSELWGIEVPTSPSCQASPLAREPSLPPEL